MTRPPRSRAGAAALGAGVGAALTLLALTLVDSDEASSDSPVPSRLEAADSAAPAPTEGHAGGVEPAAEAVADTRPGAAAVGAGNPPAPASNPIVADASPSNMPGTRTDLPNRRSDDAASASPAAYLLDASRISCDFGAGNNTGIRLGDLLTVGGGAQWQGGLILYDLDTRAGAAQMRGSVGATGSSSGGVRVQVTTEGSRVFLSAFLENGGYVMVTIFDELDNLGRHISVMSRHEGPWSYASQFLGTCE